MFVGAGYRSRKFLNCPKSRFTIALFFITKYILPVLDGVY